MRLTRSPRHAAFATHTDAHTNAQKQPSRRSGRYRSLILATSLATTLAMSSAALADGRNGERQGNRQSFTDYARVIDADPIYTRVAYERPQRECWLEEQQNATLYEGPANGRRPYNHRNGRRNVGDTLAGGLIGGVIGNQLGRKSSNGARIGAPVVGAIIGSAIANEQPGRGSDKRNKRHRRQPGYNRPVRHKINSRPVERCTTRISTEYRREISGYQVTYRYKGQTFTTRTEQHPGERLAVRISIRPLRD